MIDNSFHIITFGCQMNVHDSQWLARALEARGFCEAPLEEARVVVVNTCSVREKPEQKVMSTLGRIRQVTGNSPRVLVAVTGCVAQQLGEKLFSRQVRLVAGSDGISGAPQAIERLLDEPALRLSLLDFTSHYVEREPGADTPSAPVGFVNIMQGCDNFCAYCIVPYTRGPRKSRSTKAVLDECRAWVARGAGDITLLGQNVNVFGNDKSGDGTTFPELLRQVAAIPGLRRIRFVSAHPRDFSQETIDMFAELPQLCPRLHLPLQSGSDSMLKKMGRGYDMERYLSVVEALRKARPDIALSTDLIVGFPSETEEEFEDTLKAIDS
uniref:MiaB/RimO family radical SAM methylthiotransferase n=1 Tax=uncultured Desulfovibrio sp. TaxID=167968 RepID=UPI00265CE6E1